MQLYTKYVADTEGPLKSLRGFQRVAIPAGKTINVTFKLDDATFIGWSEEKQDMVTLSGEWQLMYGGSSDNLKSVNYNKKP